MTQEATETVHNAKGEERTKTTRKIKGVTRNSMAAPAMNIIRLAAQTLISFTEKNPGEMQVIMAEMCLIEIVNLRRVDHHQTTTVIEDVAIVIIEVVTMTVTDGIRITIAAVTRTVVTEVVTKSTEKEVVTLIATEIVTETATEIAIETVTETAGVEIDVVVEETMTMREVDMREVTILITTMMIATRQMDLVVTVQVRDREEGLVGRRMNTQEENMTGTTIAAAAANIDTIDLTGIKMTIVAGMMIIVVDHHVIMAIGTDRNMVIGTDRSTVDHGNVIDAS